MAVLFVSHSSKDDTAVNALEAWLRVNGFTDIFVDHESLAGGANWREELRASAGACRVVLCLVTENWLASYECFNEFRAAWYMGKRIIPLLLLPPVQKSDEEAAKRFAEVCAEDQGVDLKPCLKPDGALDVEADANVANRLKAGLRAAGALGRVGLDPEAFEIDRKLRPTPFPGLASFGDDDADAALFYGRSREIAQAMDALRADARRRRDAAVCDPWSVGCRQIVRSSRPALSRACGGRPRRGCRCARSVRVPIRCSISPKPGRGALPISASAKPMASFATACSRPGRRPSVRQAT